MSETKTFLIRDKVLDALFDKWQGETDAAAMRCYADAYLIVRSLSFDDLKTIMYNYGGK